MTAFRTSRFFETNLESTKNLEDYVVKPRRSFPIFLSGYNKYMIRYYKSLSYLRDGGVQTHNFGKMNIHYREEYLVYGRIIKGRIIFSKIQIVK